MKANVKELMMNAKAALAKGNKDVASDQLNMGIVVLSRLTQEGETHTEGASVNRWKERFWFELESNDLMED
ncbi:hypothetical protein UFOVP972_90 [uncultured Caudovirales phage]|jgi:hypothetical protein|uniref:Uncharacterized protein n=1 Tax=uncultured Caudovirales phage TaxID=2100421 RepID=A0A6J5PT65_9CAUD|nr:hypothetical protein UFOVP972_90 [uncultured Caudovirales phage]